MLFRLQRYESFLVWQNKLWFMLNGSWLMISVFIPRLVFWAILPALAGGLQTFVQLALQCSSLSWLQLSQARGHIQRYEKDSVLLFEVVAVQHNGSREIFAELIHACNAVTISPRWE